MDCKDIMNSNLEWLTEKSTIAGAARTMADTGLGFLPICDARLRVIGVVTDRDLTVLGGCRSGGLDPSAGPDGLTAKQIVDATVPAARREQHAHMRSAVRPERLAELVEEAERDHAQ